MKTVLVMLCVNDDRGGPSGHVSMAQFSNPWDEQHLEFVLELESPWAEDIDWDEDETDGVDDNPHAFFAERPGEIVVDDLAFPIIERREHVGNIYWNGYRMTVDAARKLALDLRALGWQVMLWTEGNPLLAHDLCGPEFSPQLAAAHPVVDEGQRPGAPGACE
jgi:hypothetical protein